MEPPPYIVSTPGGDSRATPGVKVITLLTDFGLKDPYVGIMKGVILSINPDTTIVDITHDIMPQNIEEAAFLIEEYHRFFPPGTIHMAVIDPTVGSERRPIIVSKDNNVFIGPDNGLFTLILDDTEVYLLENPDFMLKAVSSTFHGRDIFAPAAAHASTGFHPSAFGRTISDPTRLDNLFPTAEGHSLKGRIVRFDRFGNAITNIKVGFLKEFLGNRPFEIRLGSMVFTSLSKSYSENEFTCLVGSSGYLEFGYFKGSFEEQTNVRKHDALIIRTL
jgi:S-adenosylmethionine hydrolase